MIRTAIHDAPENARLKKRGPLNIMPVIAVRHFERKGRELVADLKNNRHEISVLLVDDDPDDRLLV